MQALFLYDNVTGFLQLNTHEILLIKEFDALWDVERNKCSEDKTGTKRLRAWKEFKYIWLFVDWKSPYQQYLEQEKHIAAMNDSGLTQEEWEDPIFRAAIRKYIELKNSSRVLSLIKTAYRTLEKLRISLDNIDLDERDPVNNKPIWKAKEILDNIASIGPISDKLRELELNYEKEVLANDSRVRGDTARGFRDE